jgi:glycosyltransferase involved in cell wall biosynthesis
MQNYLESRDMQILMIAPQPFYAERGTPMNVKLLCEVLGEAEFKIDLLVFPTGKDIKIKNVRIIRLPNVLKARSIPVGPSGIKLSYDILLVKAAFWLAITKKYHVIHGIEEGGFLAVMLCKLFGIRSIFDMDSSISEQLKYSGYVKSKFLLSIVEKLEKWTLKNSSAIITVCQDLTDKARSIFPDANIYQIEDIPISHSNLPNTSSSEELIKKFGLSDYFRIVYTGNLESYQGIDLLLASWKVFSKQMENAGRYRLVIVGGQKEQIERYSKIAESYGISGMVTWSGQRPSKEMGAWMDLSHVLVSPRSEGTNTPLKIYSYMSSGRPIVATRRKAHIQVLDESVAFLADSDPGKFCEAIYNALNDRKTALRKAERAKKVVEEKYSYSVFRKKLLDAYASIRCQYI